MSDNNDLPAFEDLQHFDEGGQALPEYSSLIDTQSGTNMPQSAQSLPDQGDMELPDFDTLVSPREEKYGTSSEMLKSFAEGAGRGASFGLSTGVETAAGVNPEDILARQEENPISSGAGEMAGLLASSVIPGVGEAGLLSKAGGLAAKGATKVLGESAIAKIGSKYAAAAAETALLQSGEEVHRMLANDPDQTASSAMMHVGLAALLGGAAGGIMGSASPLWAATAESKLGKSLKSLTDRMGGIEGAAPSELDNAIATSGVEIDPAVKSMMGADLGIAETGANVAEGSTFAGKNLRESLSKANDSAQEQLTGAFDRTPDQVRALDTLSEAESGESIKKTLINDLKAKIDPISEQFNKVKEKYGSVALQDADKTSIVDNIVKMSSEEGYTLSPAAPQAKLIDRVLNELPNIKTAQDLRKYSSVISDSINNPEMYRVGGQLRTILRNAEEGVVERELGEKAPDLLATHAEARAAYKSAMDTLDDLNSRLHVGKYSGPGSFIKALDEMKPEDVLRRLATKSDAGLLSELIEKFPQVASSIRDFHIDRLLKNAADKAGPEQLLNRKVLATQVDKLSPELKSFIMSPEGMQKYEAIQSVMDKIPARANPSGTAKTLDSMTGGLLPSAVGFVTALATGHVAAAGVIAANLARLVGREGSDATKLALLKFMGSSKPIDAQGFKQMVEFIHATAKGEQMLNKSAKAVFKAGSEVLSETNLPTEADRMKIEKGLKLLKTNPQGMMDAGSKAAHYMPEATAAMAASIGTALNMVQLAKPQKEKASPLDSTPVMSAFQKSQYNNVLDLAQQPLVLLSKVKEGTVSATDVQIVQSMYPAAYKSMVQKVTQQMMDLQDKDSLIPYKTRMGLSVLLGRPADSTFAPANILAAQPQDKLGEQQGQDQASAPISKTNKLSKMPGLYRTPSQTFEQRRTKE